MRAGVCVSLVLSVAASLLACDADNGEPDKTREPVETQDASTTEDASGEGDAATPSSGTYVGAAGIGVSDLQVSFAFYTEVLGMTQRYELAVPNYVNEKIMYFKDSKGSDVVLMSYIDGRTRNFRDNPVKLVFYVPNAKTVIEAIRARGLPISLEPTAQPAFGGAVVAFARDPDGYVIELVEAADLTVPYLGAVGIGVADLDRAKSFYERVMGMRAMGNLISVPGVWDEWIMQHTSGKGSSLVLMHYTDGKTRNYLNNPIKTVHFVPDVRATVASIETESLPILSPPMMFNVMGTDALISLARDPDGYILELVNQ